LIGTPGKPGLDIGDDELSIIKAHAKALAAAIKVAAVRYPAAVREPAWVTRDHLEDLYERLEFSLKPRD